MHRLGGESRTGTNAYHRSPRIRVHSVSTLKPGGLRQVGRPVVWGLACGGHTGVAKVLKILHDELRLAMMLNGCRSLSEVTRDLIFQQAKL